MVVLPPVGHFLQQGSVARAYGAIGSDPTGSSLLRAALGCSGVCAGSELQPYHSNYQVLLFITLYFVLCMSVLAVYMSIYQMLAQCPEARKGHG